MTIPDSGFMMDNGASCLPCTPEEEKQIVKDLTTQSEMHLKEGNLYYVISNRYKGGPAIPRKLISQGVYVKNYCVEVYLLCLKLIDSRDESETTIRLSKKASIRELYEKVCTLKGIQQEKVHLWDYFNKRKNLLLAASQHCLEDSNLQMDQHILLEVDSPLFGTDSTGNELALVPLEPARSSLSIAGGPSMSNGHSTSSKFNVYRGSTAGSTFIDVDEGYNAYGSTRKGDRGGLAGLQNLGNTCFMNSALQCLVHTPPIVEYFLQDYSDEINTDNPLGMHGELALAFGELLRKLWSSGRTAIAPRVFKGKLARFAPQFSGYNQHDSQELLAFLLDGLHEDLNRVKQKPYIETKDSDGRPDEEVADECWKNHKARNDSLIVDVCQGQYKSTLVCPVCDKISITFDPFMYLSLPLPSMVTRSMTVTVFYGDGSHLPMPYTVTVPKHGLCKDLILALGTACCLNSDETLLLAEIYDHRIYRYLENPVEPLNSIKDDEHIVAYRFHRKVVGKVKVEIYHGWQENVDFHRSASDYLKGGDKKLFGTPLVTYTSENPLSGADIDTTVSRILSPLTRTYSSANAHRGKENGFVSDPIDEQLNSCSFVNSEENTSSQELSFQLFLTDEKLLNYKQIEKDSLIKHGQVCRVLVEWTDKENELYDGSYLKDLPEVHKAGFTVKKTRQEAISLFSCLEAFLMEEPLGPDDMWYCPSCKKHRQANKKLDLWMLPDILVFHLKRFTYSRYLKNKIDTFVNFPIHNLDLSKYVKNKDGQSYVYELYAISNHYGGLGGGHYTAYAKLIDENRWYHFDDSHVSPINETEIKTSAAYVLFYQRVKRGEPKMQVGETSGSHSDS
ncbi:ubiquitin carboxyl-terminal hydrolase 9-like isoform X1 [Carica papaya]|uniref:ubiquitin carboxyl-terminal hydrolase 9-like isoform X1 n=2 Tax=Carica papaya TaxID=3649 RepID=UPI000B8CE90A|nr:ubiquitin carboxyl-terminal hydrolase 9-like isoform X1 [Carica papaya]XP_021900362.1 ubiquitin carboxyl-terminal hydrolase 9-like isoform X1 [Carica papaya]